MSQRSLCAVPGLRGAAEKTGVKPSGSLDLALVVADQPMSAAGMFTTNTAAAANVALCRKTLEASDTVRAVVINSGNANALTGNRGRADALSMKRAVEETCGGPALVLSTGVIGQPLPVDKVLHGIARASSRLASDVDEDLASAILTTDTFPKQALQRVTVGDRSYTIAGIAKGSGMIHPNMATMLAVMATDAPISAASLRAMLRRVVDSSFHEISVDGDTSTNDAVIALATHPDGERSLSSSELSEFEVGLTNISRHLAELIVSDGEGMTRIMELRVEGGSSPGQARLVARSVASSALVKTALAGGDPNWGRILSAVGASGAGVDLERATLEIAGSLVFDNGNPVPVDTRALEAAFSESRVHVTIGLGQGSRSCRVLTTDLSKRYVEINSEYTT